MTDTVQNALDAGAPNDLPDRFRQTQIGQIIAGLIPQRFVRAVSSNAVQVEPEAGAILIVALADDASLLQIEAGAVGAGEVLVEYDAEGVATLTFNSAQTAYRVVKQTLPTGVLASGSPASGLGTLLGTSV